jgi:hypothetical protein
MKQSKITAWNDSHKNEKLYYAEINPFLIYFFILGVPTLL